MNPAVKTVSDNGNRPRFYQLKGSNFATNKLLIWLVDGYFGNRSTTLTYQQRVARILRHVDLAIIASDADDDERI